MNRDQDLNRRRWKISYSYDCTCDPRCWYEKDGRHSQTTFLNNGEQAQGAEAAAEITARAFKHVNIADAKVWQESPEERDTRMKSMRKAEADERRGIHWNMGGAN
ncbi:hypothetical protein [Streptomyces olivoreticuli]|uniref:hypothetical protein n=1 Tax=Streptomyces olivoreticuli TaxID=68246 RepID=UPI000E287B42|nr:hypothetical protein [Streptomyces olivoreticuli]